MHQRITAVAPEQLVEHAAVSDPAPHEGRLRRHRLPVPATEVVQDHDLVAAAEQLGYHDAADVPRPPGDEDATRHLAAPGRRAA